jgi:type I restriction enzyme R subunit
LIWHTTGSGTTLTSFKTAKLARGLAGIDMVLFVVDRKKQGQPLIPEGT